MPQLLVGKKNATGKKFSVVGGFENHAKGDYSFVTGHANIASGLYFSVAGGSENDSNGESSFVAGGNGNIALSLSSSITGGLANSIGDRRGYGSITGGTENEVIVKYGSVSGGARNSAGNGKGKRGAYSSILGGKNVVLKQKLETYPM